MVRRRGTAGWGTLLVWLVALVMLAGFVPSQRHSSSSAVATVLLRAHEPSDVAPTERTHSALDRHARAAEPRCVRLGSLVREMRCASAPATIDDPRASRFDGREAVRLGDGIRRAPDVRVASRSHLRLMVFLI